MTYCYVGRGLPIVWLNEPISCKGCYLLFYTLLVRRNLKTVLFFTLNKCIDQKINNATITGRYGFAFEENLDRKITWLSSWWCHHFRKPCFQTQIKMLGFSDSPILKSIFENLYFRDGLVWTVGLTIAKKSRVFKFLWQNVDSPAQSGTLTISTSFLTKPF